MTNIEPGCGSGIVLDIGGAERETGRSKDVLRMWGRRYCSPNPARDENGERQNALARELMRQAHGIR